MLCLTMPFLLNCAGTTHRTETVTHTVEKAPVVIDTSCKWVKFIRVNPEDDITAKTARQIVAHNRAVFANCGASK